MRLYVSDLNAAAHARIRLNKEQENHVKVRRLGAGDEIILFNETHGDWKGALEDARYVVLEKQSCPPMPVPDIWLVQAVIAKDRFAFVVEKATELGVAALLPVTTRYTQGATLNEERTHQHLVEACQQCERNVIPELKSVQGLLSLLTGWDKSRTLYVAMEREEAAPAAKVLTATKAAILIGPEGGFSDEEKQLLAQHEAVTFFSLGPRILRAETAAIAALSVWQSVAGDSA